MTKPYAGRWMERVRKSKIKPTLESIFFATPEQKLIRFLLSEPTTTFSPRVLASKLKGVRGLGGAEGMNRILKQLNEMNMVHFLDNNRAVCLNNDNLTVQVMKTFLAISDLEGIRTVLEPLSTKGILFGSRASGDYRSDSDYNLFVASDQPEEVSRLVTSHPMGKLVSLECWTPDEFLHASKKNAKLSKELDTGISLWESNW